MFISQFVSYLSRFEYVLVASILFLKKVFLIKQYWPYLRNLESEFEKEKEAPKEKLPDSNPLTNLLTLNNFIDFSDRISKLEHEKKLQDISQVQSEELIERFERQNDDLKNQLIISQNQQICLQDSLDISNDRNKGILLRGIKNKTISR